ncbi:tRNA methyltransferase 10 homolog A [Frankliniella occidentalis]|uniref:tRNA (guanine(9)-N(1))-methyltransferase n=1 Tax=Frankliniella occidentalis TaxID=133901 RepID=A0A6J1SCU9_FRAOC|nr:tRNA methyltransferase 10 homolog A [Frankliniella occidentalis]
MDDETDTKVSPTQTVIKSPEAVENENDSNNANTNQEGQQLSKRMLRKIRKREQWLAKLPEKRAKEREKMKLKRKAARENNESLTSRKQLKQSTMANSSCQVRVAVDLDFDDLMNPRDLGKCVKQLMRCYTLNRRAANPMQLYFTSFNGKSEQEMSKNNGYSNWDVHFKEEPYSQVFQTDDIVYLTSESDNIVTTLDETKVYVIGGLVDHNGHKGLCHRLAEEKKIAHAQLPISEFLELKSRKVLTIDHVFEILLGVSEGLSWKDAFLKVLPQRKGAIGKKENDDHNSTSESSATSESESKNCIALEPLKTCTSESNGTLETEGSITIKGETVEMCNEDVKKLCVDGSQST